MDLREEALTRAIAAANAAATDPSRWNDCVQSIADATNAAGAGLFRPGPSPRGGPIANYGTFLGLEAVYFDRWAHRDPWNEAGRGRHLFDIAGTVRVSREFLTDPDYRRTAYYNEHGRYCDSGHKLFLKVSDDQDPDMPVTHLTFSRSFRQEPFGAHEQRAVKQLWLPLQRALKAQALLTMDGRLRAMTADSFDVHPMPSWILRSNCRIDHANSAALQLMNEGRWLSVQGNRLVSMGDVDVHRLEHLLQQARRGQGDRRLVSFQASKKASIELGTLHVLPITKSPLHGAAWPHADAMVILERPPHLGDGLQWIPHHVSQRFGLTDKETEVLALFRQRIGSKAIAARLGNSEQTVRVHFRNLKSKTGVKSLYDLLWLVSGNR